MISIALLGAMSTSACWAQEIPGNKASEVSFAAFLQSVQDDFSRETEPSLNSATGPTEQSSSAEDDQELPMRRGDSGSDEKSQREGSGLTQVDAEPLDAPAGQRQNNGQADDPTGTPNGPDGPIGFGSPDGSLALADVIASVYQSHPDIQRARQENTIANGLALSAQGVFDTEFNGHSISEPTGFYQTYRNGLGVARRNWWGGKTSLGYRIGRGRFQPWFEGRQTNDAGEVKLSYAAPLLQGRAIDPERIAIFQASLAQQAAGPTIQRTILDISAQAAAVYWDWLAAGLVLETQKNLLGLAEERAEQIEAGVQAKKFAEIDLLLNQQLIAERRAKLLETEQKYRASAFKLSLYLRDENGHPLIPATDWLPKQFPRIDPNLETDFDNDLASALQRRPDLRLLELELRNAQLDLRGARNQFERNLDFFADISQDFGEPSTSSEDKGEFELVIGVSTKTPIQRRGARGKIQSSAAKITQVQEKLRLGRDKISIELQTAQNALELSTQIVQQTEVAMRASLDTLERFRFAFEKGKIDLIGLNLLETKTNETNIKLIDSQRTWFVVLAQLQVALGLDPLDQSLNLAELLPSDMPDLGALVRPVLDVPDK